MNRYAGSIDTDAAIGTILGNFETEYVNHVIDDSLKMKFRPFAEPMPNLADVIEKLDLLQMLLQIISVKLKK